MVVNEGVAGIGAVGDQAATAAGIAHFALLHLPRCVDGKLLEWIDRYQDGARARVDVIATVSDANSVQKRGLAQFGELDHVRGTVEAESVRFLNTPDLLLGQDACGRCAEGSSAHAGGVTKALGLEHRHGCPARIVRGDEHDAPLRELRVEVYHG